jgi:hypothetical protein
MRKLLSIIVLVALSCSAGFWFGQSHANRHDGNATQPRFSGNINVVVDGDPLQAGSAVRSNSLAVDGDLKIRSLPNGKVGLEGHLNVRPN